jgi:hypothetical protein
MDLASNSALAGKLFDRIAFRGGGVDPQTVLSTSSPDAIQREIRERVREVLGVTPRYVLSSIQNVLGDAPSENVIAQLQGLHEVRGLTFEVQR